VVASARESRRATKEVLAETCMQLEHQGLDAAEPNVLLASFQDAGQFTPATRSRYEFLATRAAFTGALGHGMPVTPVAGVRGADLAADDPLRGEWDLIVIGPGSRPPWSPSTSARRRRARGPAPLRRRGDPRP
jgi:Sensory domain in DIguanylate Cyclases and Two-component system